MLPKIPWASSARCRRLSSISGHGGEARQDRRNAVERRRPGGRARVVLEAERQGRGAAGTAEEEGPPAGTAPATGAGTARNEAETALGRVRQRGRHHPSRRP